MCWADRKWFHPPVDLAGAGLCVFFFLIRRFHFLIFNSLSCFFSVKMKQAASCTTQGCWLQLLNICHSFSHFLCCEQNKNVIVLFLAAISLWFFFSKSTMVHETKIILHSWDIILAYRLMPVRGCQDLHRAHIRFKIKHNFSYIFRN